MLQYVGNQNIYYIVGQGFPSADAIYNVVLGQLYYLHPENAVTAGSWNSGNSMEESETQQRNPPGMTDDLVSLVVRDGDCPLWQE